MSGTTRIVVGPTGGVVECGCCRRAFPAWLIHAFAVPAFRPSGALAVVGGMLCPVCADQLLPDAPMLRASRGAVAYYADGLAWFRRGRPETCAGCGSRLSPDMSNLFYRLPPHTGIQGLCRHCASRVVRAEIEADTLRPLDARRATLRLERRRKTER